MRNMIFFAHLLIVRNYNDFQFSTSLEMTAIPATNYKIIAVPNITL